MSRFFGRKSIIRQIAELHAKSSPDHISVVGPRSMGKTALLQAVVAQHREGSRVFAGAALLDLRHDPPTTSEAALARVGFAIRGILAGLRSEHRELASYIQAEDVVELRDQLKIAVDELAGAGLRVLLVLDGCDPVLQNSAIPRNLWDSLRALAQSPGLRLMTGTRAPLHELCYNPDARVSDFFRIFYDQPLFVGSFEQDDWAEVYRGCGIALDASAQKELRNWAGGHPDLVNLLLDRLAPAGKPPLSKAHVDTAAEGILDGGSQRLEALWNECPAEVKGDLVQLTKAELSVAEIPPERLHYTTARGFVTKSGGKVRLSCRLIEKKAVARTGDVSGVRQLFGTPEAFETNIRAVLEMQLGVAVDVDPELRRTVLRCIRHLPDEPEATLDGARSILDRALDLIWEVEAPTGIVPDGWIQHWKYTPAASKSVEVYSRDRSLPEERGRQCDLLRLATGRPGIKPIASKVSKQACVLVEHMNQIGNMKNHSRCPPTLTMAVAFCFAAIELCEALRRDLG
ncbi:Hypothetical protein A7982_11609 [Minicystis rosea]|nr:Hypothetical protein A7982_11609 [Minicystis rosea]